MNIRIKKISTLVSLCLIQAALYPYHVFAEDAQFDMAILKNRGLDTSIGDYFASSAKFTPGRKPVSLTVNGKDKGSVTARFGKDGELCVDHAFLQSAGLQVPSTLRSDKINESECHDYKQDFPSTVITLLPGEEGLELVVPQDALATEEFTPENIAHGGTAGILNYSLMSTQSSYSGGQSRYDQLSLEDGFNFHDWLLRNRQNVTRMDGEMSAENLYTYVQHTFENIKTLMQAGQINISDTLFSGASINGAQIIPESGLVDNSGSGVTVSGIANSAQARVEVKQGGRVVYSTLVPAGPFTLDNVPVTSLSMALDVTVIETSGSQTHFIVPADALRGHLAAPQGLSIAMGQTQDKGDDGRQPFLMTATDGWRVKPWLNISAGGMAAQEYEAVAAQFDILPLSHVSLSSALRVSRDAHGDNNGHSSNLSLNYSATKSLAFSASATRYSEGYRELTDTLDDDFEQYTGQYSLNGSWNNAHIGAFSLGYSLSQAADGEEDSRYMTASWGRTFTWASVSVNWQHLLNKQDDSNESHNNNYGDMVYINLSVPIGTQRVSAYMHQNGDSTRSGLSTSGDISRNSYYSISAERDKEDKENSFNGSLNSNLHYTQLGISAGVEGRDNRNSSLTLNGGVVAHRSGVTFTPYSVQDTFAIASLDDNVSGIEIDTPEGSVWTDHWGQAVVPSLAAYKTSRVEMNTETLPKNIDVNNGISVVAAGHGSVSTVNFSVLKVRRAMLNVTLADGRPLPKNATLVDGSGNYITTVVDDGLVYLNDANQVKELILTDYEGKNQCQIHYSLAEKRNSDELYEQVKGVCQ